ncbi:MAG: hypothetical protein V1773_19520 [bacterium]
MIEKELLERILIKEIINRISFEQKIPLSFEKVKLTSADGIHYTGKITCGQPRRLWDLPIIVTVENYDVKWNIDDGLAIGHFIISN